MRDIPLGGLRLGVAASVVAIYWLAYQGALLATEDLFTPWNLVDLLCLPGLAAESVLLRLSELPVFEEISLSYLVRYVLPGRVFWTGLLLGVLCLACGPREAPANWRRWALRAYLWSASIYLLSAVIYSQTRFPTVIHVGKEVIEF